MTTKIKISVLDFCPKCALNIRLHMGRVSNNKASMQLDPWIMRQWHIFYFAALPHYIIIVYFKTVSLVTVICTYCRNRVTVQTVHAPNWTSISGVSFLIRNDLCTHDYLEVLLEWSNYPIKQTYCKTGGNDNIIVLWTWETSCPVILPRGPSGGIISVSFPQRTGGKTLQILQLHLSHSDPL